MLVDTEVVLSLLKRYPKRDIGLEVEIELLACEGWRVILDDILRVLAWVVVQE